MITKSLFDEYNGKPVYIYTIANDFVSVGILNFGATVNFIKLNTVQGEKNICIGYNCIQSYVDSKAYCGATVGRIANRVAGAKFELDGKQFILSANEGNNCLHGGEEGFDKRFYTAEIKGDTLALSLVSPDGDMGFHGELHFRAEFTLIDRELLVKYIAKSNKTTAFAPTCHIYFNLNGGDVMDTVLNINADSYTPVDNSLVPTGEIKSVIGTPFDFTKPKTIGRDYGELGGNTYDNNFCLGGNYVGTAYSQASGVKLNVYTDLPGVQLYVGCPAINENGGGNGFCLEPQFFPNAVNVKAFKSPVLPSGCERTYSIRYTFDF